MNKNRENNYDLLRIICTLAVISIHVSSTYWRTAVNFDIWTARDMMNTIVVCLYYACSSFAVPCFVMLSGAFILDDERNSEFRYFYKKTFIKLGIPMIAFSILYFLYYFMVCVAQVLLKGMEYNILLTPIMKWIKGVPFYHMWYLYMMIGVYLLAPIVIRLKKEVGEDKFVRISLVFVVLACISVCTSSHRLYWDIGLSFCYLGYFAMGYVIRKWAMNKKSNVYGLGLIVIGLGIEAVIGYVKYLQIMDNISDDTLTDPYCPLILIASICIFGGVSMIRIGKNLGKIAALTFPVYLVHAGVWDLIGPRVDLINANCIIAMPLFIIVVFLISVGISLVIKKIENAKR